MRISVVGAGYVGLCVCAFFGQRGHTISCLEKDGKKIETLRAGQLPFYEKGLLELLQSCSQRLSYTDAADFSEAEAVFLCVGTPQGRGGALDLRGLYEAADALAATISEGCLVVVKSTVPIGASDALAAYLGRRARCGDFDLCCVPEFLSQGLAVQDALHPQRVVAGAEAERAREKLRDLYEGCRLFEVTRREAETVKLAANAYLALRVSYANELSNLCEAVGADVSRVLAAVGADERIGARYLSPGAGFGGSCLPKDAAALLSIAREKGLPFETVRAALFANERQKVLPLRKARRYYRSFASLRAAVLGASFKANTDDIRCAPALETIDALLREGARVRVWDGAALARLAGGSVETCETIEAALEGADVCFIFADWEQVRRLDVHTYARLMRSPLVIDGRNCYDPASFAGTGVTYVCFGKCS